MWLPRRRDFLGACFGAWGLRFLQDSPSRALAADNATETFAQRQQRRRQELWKLLGDLPPRDRAISVKTLKTEKGDGYTLEHLELDLNGLEPVPAVLLLPDRRRKKAPGLVYIHAHGGTYELGKEELRARPGGAARLCAGDAPSKGIVTLAIDSWCFSQRQHKQDGRQGENDAFKEMLWRGRVLWGMMMYDEVQAVSYLAGRPEVDPQRIGAFGLSMGSTKAWWLAALDPRVKLCVDLCCLTDFEELIKIDNLRGHGIYYYVPRPAQALSGPRHQRADRAAAAPEPERPSGPADPAGRRRANPRSPVALYRKYGREAGLPHRAVRLRPRGNARDAGQSVLEWFDKHLVGA